MTRRLLLMTLLMAATAGLSACGKRGDPHLPEGTVGTYPRPYPDPATVRPNTSAGKSAEESEEQTN